jgi:hypothetical protein
MNPNFVALEAMYSSAAALTFGRDLLVNSVLGRPKTQSGRSRPRTFCAASFMPSTLIMGLGRHVGVNHILDHLIAHIFGDFGDVLRP